MKWLSPDLSYSQLGNVSRGLESDYHKYLHHPEHADLLVCAPSFLVLSRAWAYPPRSWDENMRLYPQ